MGRGWEEEAMPSTDTKLSSLVSVTLMSGLGILQGERGDTALKKDREGGGSDSWSLGVT